MKRVLIIDDSPVIHNLLRKTLESNDYEVCGDGRNGKEGVELYKKLTPDVVFMDVTMPILDGIGATKEIIKINPEATIIMLTAMGDEEMMNEAKTAGVKIFLKKPFDEYKIISALSKVI
jgi:two-component system chemotaxis response regulator CheY